MKNEAEDQQNRRSDIPERDSPIPDEGARGASEDVRPDAGHEERLAAKLPDEETRQPDPILRLSVGRMGAKWMVLLAVIVAIIVGVVIYGLNQA